MFQFPINLHLAPHTRHLTPNYSVYSVAKNQYALDAREALMQQLQHPSPVLCRITEMQEHIFL
jgi:hypothetical protein